MATLIYRGYVYQHERFTQQPYQKPCGLNWRYHAPGESYGEVHNVPTYCQPRAINWRYQPV